MNSPKRTGLANPLNQPHRTTRLLPWSGPEGKPCYLLTDGSGGGYVSRIADQIESVQLDMGAELVGHAQELLNDPKAGAGELRFLSARLTEALRDALRVVESRRPRHRCLAPTTRTPQAGTSPCRQSSKGSRGRLPGLPSKSRPSFFPPLPELLEAACTN